jgi:hypothetical protein
MPVIEGASSVLQNAGAPVNGTDETQTLTYAGGDAVAVAGTFKLNFEGYRTTDLAYNISAANMQVALRLLPSIGSAGVTVSVAAGPPRVYTVTFGGTNMAKKAQPLITVEDNTMTANGGGAVTITVAEGTPGVTATALGAPKGALLVDTTTPDLYINDGTPAAPTWTKVSP